MAKTNGYHPHEHSHTRRVDTSEFSSASIYSSKAIAYAADLTRLGKPVGLFNRGVCAIWGDGESEDFVAAVFRIKGEKRGNRPLAATLETKRLLTMIDTAKIPQSVEHIFTDAEELSSRIGSLCFVRVPIKETAAKQIPPSLLSRAEDGTAVIQNWDPRGHGPALRLLQAMHKRGIVYPAITSMNESEKPEIVHQQEGIAFARERGIPLFLYDSLDKGDVKGSYTIVDVSSKEGIKLVRDGNIPGFLFDTLFEAPIDRSHAHKAKYEQLVFPADLTKGLSPSAARIAILSFANGQNHKQRHKNRKEDKKT